MAELEVLSKCSKALRQLLGTDDTWLRMLSRRETAAFVADRSKPQRNGFVRRVLQRSKTTLRSDDLISPTSFAMVLLNHAHCVRGHVAPIGRFDLLHLSPGNYSVVLTLDFRHHFNHVQLMLTADFDSSIVLFQEHIHPFLFNASRHGCEEIVAHSTLTVTKLRRIRVSCQTFGMTIFEQLKFVPTSGAIIKVPSTQTFRTRCTNNYYRSFAVGAADFIEVFPKTRWPRPYETDCIHPSHRSPFGLFYSLLPMDISYHWISSIISSVPAGIYRVFLCFRERPDKYWPLDAYFEAHVLAPNNRRKQTRNMFNTQFKGPNKRKLPSLPHDLQNVSIDTDRAVISKISDQFDSLAARAACADAGADPWLFVVFSKLLIIPERLGNNCDLRLLLRLADADCFLDCWGLRAC